MVDGFKTEAKKITDNQEKISFLKFAKIFKERVIDTHILQAGRLRTLVTTAKLNQELENLVESILENEPQSDPESEELI